MALMQFFLAFMFIGFIWGIANGIVMISYGCKGGKTKDPEAGMANNHVFNGVANPDQVIVDVKEQKRAEKAAKKAEKFNGKAKTL